MAQKATSYRPISYVDPVSQDTSPVQGSAGFAFVAIGAWSASGLQYVRLNADVSGNLLTSGGGGGGGSVTQGTIPWVVSVNTATYNSSSGSVSVSGDNTIRTPTGGKSTQLYYYMLNASPANAGNLTVTLRFSSGSPITTIGMVPGSVLARNIGAGKYYIQGAINDTLIINISGTGTVNWAIEYLEV